LGQAQERVATFVRELKEARSKRDQLTLEIEPGEIEERSRLSASPGASSRISSFVTWPPASLSHGANFSVPGAGKTTVAFALHLLVASEGEHLLSSVPKPRSQRGRPSLRKA
jgi:hypothetical protein